MIELRYAENKKPIKPVSSQQYLVDEAIVIAKSENKVVEITQTPRTRFCWHCSRQLRGNHFATYETGSGEVIVHKDCKEILDGGFDHVIAVDDAEWID